MPAILAPSAAPPEALTIWTDGRVIFVELPGAYVTKLPLTESGLSKALNLIRARRVDYAGAVQAPRRMTKAGPNGTAKQYAMAEKILREKGVIK